MKLKLLLILYVFFNTGFDLFSQDIIFLKDYSDTIYCNILKDNVLSLLYQKYDSEDTVIYSIKTSDTEGYVLGKSRLTDSEFQKYNNQSNEILFEEGKKERPPAGIYQTYNQFITKSPFLRDSISSIYHKGGRLFFIPNKHGENDTAIEPIKYKDKIWGYCNGNTIYILYWGKFCQILTTGKYSLFINENGNNGLYMGGGIIGGLASDAFLASSGTKYSDALKYIDYESGDIHNLYFNYVKNGILSQDPELLQEFISEPQHKDVITIIKYINKFNTRNPIKKSSNKEN